MPIADLMNRAVTITARTEADDFDNRPADGAATETVGALQQASSNEPVDQGEMEASEWRLFLPAETEIDGSSIVTVDGNAYEVVGEPYRAANERTGAEHHVEVGLRRA